MQKIKIVGLSMGTSKKENKPFYLVNWLSPITNDKGMGFNCYSSFVTSDEYERSKKYFDKEVNAVCIHAGTFHKFEIVE